MQYPDIEEIVRVDLRALRRIFGILRWFMPDYGFDTIYREIREMVLAELDYRREASAIEKIAANFAARKQPAARALPARHAEFSTARVLTTEWMEGIKVADLERLEQPGSIAAPPRASASRPTASRSSSTASITPIRTPGTCWCSDAGRSRAQPPTIVFLDFGATATVSEAMRRGNGVVPPGRHDARHDPDRRRP